MAALGACTLRPTSSQFCPILTCPAGRRQLGLGDCPCRTPQRPQPQNDCCWGAGDHRKGVPVPSPGARGTPCRIRATFGCLSEPRLQLAPGPCLHISAGSYSRIPSIRAPTDFTPPKPMKMWSSLQGEQDSGEVHTRGLYGNSAEHSGVEGTSGEQTKDRPPHSSRREAANPACGPARMQKRAAACY